MSTEQHPLRIGILLRNRHDGPGGLEKVLEIVAREIPKQNVELKFYALYRPKYDDFTKEFISLTCLPLPRSLSLLERILPAKIFRIFQKSYVKRNGMRLFTIMQSDELDLLITLDLSKQFLGNYEFLKTFKEQVNIPILSWVHSSLSSNSLQTVQAVKDRIHLFDGHLAISRGISEELERMYGAENVRVIYNPVEASELIKGEPNQFVYIGRIDKNKRVSSLLKQLQQLTGQWSLDIYGSTGKESYDHIFIKYIEALGLANHVNFYGWQADVWNKVKKAGVLLLNSEKEAFGMVVIEAMQRGIPVISSDSLGPRDLIEHGKNGWLYPVNHEEKIAYYLQQIIDRKILLPCPIEIRESVQKFNVDNYLSCFINNIKDIKEENSNDRCNHSDAGI